MYVALRSTFSHRHPPHTRNFLPLLRPASSLSPTPQKPFLATYDAKKVEEGWYEWWEKEGYFRPNDTKKEKPLPPYTLITPPPNVTGTLHIGHALTLSVEDCLARYHRMAGRSVHWIPGTDHAGIGTQSVVEKMLMRERGLTRHDLGRDAFVKEVWAWRQKYGNHILNQMRRMGASVDWDNVFFTMDKPRYEAVERAFVQLYKDGMIYRDTRLVNWCCALETVISDIEVEYKEVEGRTLLPIPGRPEGVEFGVLHQFAYPVVDPDAGGVQKLIVSTTRIETMLGDCAVAVHPDDPRYKSLHGKYVLHPIHKTKLPIICDDQLVDMEFGTGVVKITPAHDPNDFACARRHDLPIISIFDKLGKLNENAGVPEWKGKDRFDLRSMVIDKLDQLGCYEGRNDRHAMRVATCSRSGDVIEPLIQPQWYVRCTEIAKEPRKQVEDGLVQIHPKGHTQDWYRWLDNIQDWCISRQLWWGHEIPAYQVNVPNQENKEMWVVALDEDTAHDEAKDLLKKHGLPESTEYTLVKDEDVLDTWFSAGLLPLSALGWTGKPNETTPARYPLQVMETGYDILFFWVARMAMLATYFTKQPPFENIFLHAMVRDAQGRKMSKSLGNVIDPLHVIEGVDLETLKSNIRNSNLPAKEIEKSIKNLDEEYPLGIEACGTDALRFALIAYTQQSRQINLDISNVVQISHFCNKLWNLFKFGFGRFEKDGYAKGDLISFAAGVDPTKMSLANRFILSRMADTITKVQDGFDNYRLHDAADAVRRFIVEDVCDVYVEFSKATLNNGDIDPKEKDATLNILHACMDVSLRLAHPFMPFVTEELWHHLRQRVPCSSGTTNSLMIEAYPDRKDFGLLKDDQVEDHFDVVLSIIHASRSLRQGHQIGASKELPFSIYCRDAALLQPLRLYLNEIKAFVRASDVDISAEEPAAATAGNWTVRAIHDGLKIRVPTDQVVRAQLEKAASSGQDIQTIVTQRKAKATQKMTKIKRDRANLETRMNKEGYAESVPEAVKEKNRQRIRALELQLETLEHDLKMLDMVSSFPQK